MKDLKIWVKMALGIGLLLLLVVLNGGLSITTLSGIDAQVDAISKRYIPLVEAASKFQVRLKDVPASMNLYMLTGSAEHWKTTDTALTESEKYIGDLKRRVYSESLIDNGYADRAITAFDVFAKILRQAHDANETLIKQRASMVKAGAELGETIAKLKSQELGLIDTALANADSDEAVELMRRIRVIDALSENIQKVRISMLRSLAEQNRAFAKDNLPVLFPKAFAAVDELEKLIRIDELKALIQSIRKDMTIFQNYQMEVLKLWESTDELAKQRTTTRLAVLDASAEISAQASSMQNESVNQVVADSARSMTVTAVVCVVVVLLGLFVGFVMTRSVSGPLAAAVHFAQSVAGGELSRRLQLRRKDEIGQLSLALDSMVDALNEKIGEANRKSEEAAEKQAEALKAMSQAEQASNEAKSKTAAMLAAADRLEEVANIVSSASSELSAQIEQSERGASEQAARVSETATAMEEMNSTVLEVARNAGAASEVSTKTREKADSGALVVRKAVAAIQRVQQESLELKQDMAALDEQAKSITQIMSVISDIADQTNLLALNAAIEAARAGEAGRGFAVVADEVRKLAEKTMASTTDVGNAIKAIQQSASKSMIQVDESVVFIEEATTLANQSGDALSEIVGMVDKTADQVRAIATASEQQSASSEEINQSITQVNAIAGETARAMEEAARAVSDLAGQAHVLTELIDKMKGNK